MLFGPVSASKGGKTKARALREYLPQDDDNWHDDRPLPANNGDDGWHDDGWHDDSCYCPYYDVYTSKGGKTKGRKLKKGGRKLGCNCGKSTHFGESNHGSINLTS